MPSTGHSRGRTRRADRRMARIGPRPSTAITGATGTNRAIASSPGRMQKMAATPSTRWTRSQETMNTHHRPRTARRASPGDSLSPR